MLFIFHLCVAFVKIRIEYCFLKMDLSRPLFLYFCLFNTQLTEKNVQYINKLFPMTGFEAIALPTEPQPLPELSNVIFSQF